MAEASRTAVLVCQGRAVAHGRLASGRFNDPTALPLLRDGERRAVELARSTRPPKGLAARTHFELLGRQAEAMVARTVAIDDAVRAGGNPQAVILGAGLDGRAWRMPELSAVHVFEVDHPASQQDKRERAAGLPQTAASLTFVPMDFTDADLDSALAAAGHDLEHPTTWLLEGVLPYLSAGDAAAMVAAVAARSAPGSRLVVSYQTASSQTALARLLARAFLLVTTRKDPMANEPRRSSWTPDSVRELLADAGLQVINDLRLVTLAAELSISTRHLGSSRVAVAEAAGS